MSKKNTGTVLAVAAVAFAAYAVNAYSKATKTAKAQAAPVDAAKAQQDAALSAWTKSINQQFAMFDTTMTDSQGHLTQFTPYGRFTL